MPLPLRRDGAVQNTVGITGDGGHGGFQLVGHIGDKVPALTLRLRQRVRHGVEGLGQLTDLVAAVQLGDAHVEITGGIGAGGLHHVGDGLDLPHGGDGAGKERDQQNDGGGHQEHADEGTPHLHDLRLVHHCQHDTHQLTFAAENGNGHGELLDAVGAVDVAAALIQRLFPQNVVHDILGDGDAAAHQLLVGGQQHVALGRADEEVHIRHAGRHVRQLPQCGALVDAGVSGGGKVVGGHLGDQLGAGAHLAPLVRRGGAVAEGKEADAQQQQRQQHHTGGQRELMPVETVESPFELLDHDGCFTSNL